MHSLFIRLVVHISIIFLVGAYPSGGPAYRCSWPEPHHGVSTQTSDPPYDIMLNATTYKPGDRITVTLTGNETTFKGFMLRGFLSVGDNLHIPGIFSHLPNAAVGKNWYGQENSCVTHSSSALKTTLSFIWQSPSEDYYGDIYIGGTIVFNYHTYWTNVKSHLLKCDGCKGIHHRKQIGKYPSLPDLSTCQTTTGCLTSPSMCSLDGNCDSIVMFNSINNSVHFKLWTKDVEYIALGLSKDKLMKNTEVFICGSHGNQSDVELGYNPGYYYTRHTLDHVYGMAVARRGNYVSCEFNVESNHTLEMFGESYSKSSQGRQIHVDLLDTAFYLFLARGTYVKDSEWINKHSYVPTISKTEVYLSHHGRIGSTTLPFYMKFHGAMQVVAWLFSGVVGALVARHSRKGLGDKKLGGIKIWFQSHRFLMFIAFFFSLAAVVFMFISIPGWTKIASSHAIAGLVSLSGGVIQIAVAFLRPAIDHPKRYIFLWTHRTMALVSFVGAITAFFLVTSINNLESIFTKHLRSLLFAWLGSVVVIALGLEIFKYIDKSSEYESITNFSNDEKEIPLRDKVLNGSVIVASIIFGSLSIAIIVLLAAT